MGRYIKTLQPIVVYDTHSMQANEIATLPADKMVKYVREKRRGGTNWLELEINGYKKGYILKDKSTLAVCRHVELSDKEASGFGYSFFGKNDLSFRAVFTPVNASDPLTIPDYILQNTRTIPVQRQKDKGRTATIMLRYDPRLVEVTAFSLDEKEAFYIMKPVSNADAAFMEIDNLYGKKGFLLKDTSCTPLKDK